MIDILKYIGLATYSIPISIQLACVSIYRDIMIIDMCMHIYPIG